MSGRSTPLWFSLILLSLSVALPVGLADNWVTIQSGNITTVALVMNTSRTDVWCGSYGELLIGSGAGSGWSLVSNLTVVENATEVNFTASCDELSGYLLISNSSETPDINSLGPCNLSDLDALSGAGSDSATNTFTVNTTFVIGGNTITDVPTTYPYVNNESQNDSFREGCMTDGSALIFVAELEDGVTGFDGAPHDFQFMTLCEVPRDYHIFAYFICAYCGDDVCQSGETCSSCPEDCGECGERPGCYCNVMTTYYGVAPFGLPPEVEPPVTPQTPIVKVSIELDKKEFYLGANVTGAVIVEYTGQADLTPTLRIVVGNGLASYEDQINLSAPGSRVLTRFNFDIIAPPGQYSMLALLKGADNVSGTKSASEDFMILARELPEVTPPLKPAEAVAKCKLFGVGCTMFLTVLVAGVALLSILLASRLRHKKREEPDVKAATIVALKESLTKEPKVEDIAKETKKK